MTADKNITVKTETGNEIQARVVSETTVINTDNRLGVNIGDIVLSLNNPIKMGIVCQRTIGQKHLCIYWNNGEHNDLQIYEQKYMYRSATPDEIELYHRYTYLELEMREKIAAKLIERERDHCPQCWVEDAYVKADEILAARSKLNK